MCRYVRVTRAPAGVILCASVTARAALVELRVTRRLGGLEVSDTVEQVGERVESFAAGDGSSATSKADLRSR